MPAPRPIPPTLPGSAAPPLTEADIDQALSERETGEQVPTAVRDFRVDNDGAAEWCMRHVRQLDGRIKANVEQAAEWHRPIDEWLIEANGPLQSELEFFQAFLIDYQLRLRQADPEAKSVKLPSGTVTSTQTAPAVQLLEVDGTPKAKIEAGVIAWLRETFTAEQLDQAVPIKVAESVLLTGLRELVQIVEVCDKLDDDGEPIEGERFARPYLNDQGKPWRVVDNVRVIQRWACPLVNPETGQAWGDDVALEDIAVPGLIVSEPKLTITVKPKPVDR